MARKQSLGRLVVDANIVMGALLRDGSTRHLFLSAGLDLHAPVALWSELERNQAYLLRKSGATMAAYNLLMRRLQAVIIGVPDEVVRERMPEAMARLSGPTPLDAPYAAAAMAIRARLWTHDKRLAARAGVECVNTAQVLEELAARADTRRSRPS